MAGRTVGGSGPLSSPRHCKGTGQDRGLTGGDQGLGTWLKLGSEIYPLETNLQEARPEGLQLELGSWACGQGCGSGSQGGSLMAIKASCALTTPSR